MNIHHAVVDIHIGFESGLKHALHFNQSIKNQQKEG
jgi:hypothetical protein